MRRIGAGIATGARLAEDMEDTGKMVTGGTLAQDMANVSKMATGTRLDQNTGDLSKTAGIMLRQAPVQSLREAAIHTHTQDTGNLGEGDTKEDTA